MKRTVQMKNAGTPSATQPSKFKGFRGIGKPKHEWRPDGPIKHKHPIRMQRKTLKMAKAASLLAGLRESSNKLRSSLE